MGFWKKPKEKIAKAKIDSAINYAAKPKCFALYVIYLSWNSKIKIISLC